MAYFIGNFSLEMPNCPNSCYSNSCPDSNSKQKKNRLKRSWSVYPPCLPAAVLYPAEPLKIPAMSCLQSGLWHSCQVANVPAHISCYQSCYQVCHTAILGFVDIFLNAQQMFLLLSFFFLKAEFKKGGSIGKTSTKLKGKRICSRMQRICIFQ